MKNNDTENNCYFLRANVRLDTRIGFAEEEGDGENEKVKQNEMSLNNIK